MLAYLRFEVIRSLRDTSFLAFLIGLPVLLYLVYGRDDAVMQGAQFRAYYLVSMASFAAVGGAMSANGTGLAMDRASGWIRQLRITPLSGRAWLASKTVHSLLLITPGLLAVGATGISYGEVRLSPGGWAAVAAILVLGATPFVLIGLAIGLVLNVRAAQLASTVVFLGLTFVSGVLVPWPHLPDLAQATGSLLPLYHMADLGWEAVGQDPVDWTHAAVLGIWTALLAAAILELRRREFTATG